jgi:cytochrome c556
MRTICGLVILILAGAAANSPGSQAPRQLTVQDYDARMKNIGETYPAMQKNLMAKQGADAAKQAQELAVLFGDVERFWEQQKKPDAVKFAQQARTLVTEAAGAAAAGDLAKAGQAAGNMQGVCNQCHGTYREMDPAGGFRIRPRALLPS